MVAVINVVAYLFFGFLRSDLSPWGYRNRSFLVALCYLTVRRRNFGIMTKRVLHQQVKRSGYFYCHVTHGSVSLLLFLVLWIFMRSLAVICYDRRVLCESHKNYFKSQRLINSQCTFAFLTSFWLNAVVILSKAHKPDNFESHNSLKLCFTNI